MEKQEKLEKAIIAIENVCEKILKQENYQQEMQMCIQAVNDSCYILVQQNSKSQEILEILQDMMYGMTQKDGVFLLDVLRFGLKTELEQACRELENNKPEGIYE